MSEDSDTIYGYPRMESVCKGGNSHLLNFASAYAKGCELEEETRILKKEIDELKQENERLENLTASGIHTCHSECQRPMCVLRRERDKLAAELMKVTEERDERKRTSEFHDHARALEIETQELAEALEECADELGSYGMYSESNSAKDPVVKARAVLARHRAKQ